MQDTKFGTNNEYTPLVTIYITTYNRLTLLKRAVESARNQDYHNIEILIVNDNSNDSTEDYLKAISTIDNRIRHFTNYKNLGACSSRNIAINNANGEFITGLDDDDFFLPYRISDFLSAWQLKLESTVALTSSVKFLYKNNKTTTLKRPRIVKKHHLIDNGNFVGSQVFTYTRYLREIGGFDEQMPIMQDFECWLRLLDISAHASIESINNTSYIVDASHPYERVSHNRLEKLNKALMIILGKHEFSELEKEILMMRLDIEKKNIIPLSLYLRKIIRNPIPRNIKGTFGLLYRSHFARR